MDIDEARQFLRDNHRAVLATLRRDGRPQLSPITIGVDEEGFAVVSSRETAYKVRNLRRDPRVSACIMNDGFFGAFVQTESGRHAKSMSTVEMPRRHRRTEPDPRPAASNSRRRRPISTTS